MPKLQEFNFPKEIEAKYLSGLMSTIADVDLALADERRHLRNEIENLRTMQLKSNDPVTL